LGSQKHHKARGELRRSLVENRLLVDDITVREGRADTILLGELELLKTIPTLAQYNIAHYEDLYTLENNKLKADIQDAAPRLCELLSTLYTNQRNQTPPTFTRILAIISNIYYTRGQRLSSYLPTILAVELHSKGAHKTLIQLCHAFRLTVSYTSTIRTINALKSKAIANSKRLAMEGNIGLAYDNCELTISVT